MFSTPAGPPRFKPTPLDGPELLVHPHRANALDKRERWLCCVFLERYAVYLARKRNIGGLRNALGLLTEVAGTPVRSRG